MGRRQPFKYTRICTSCMGERKKVRFDQFKGEISLNLSVFVSTLWKDKVKEFDAFWSEHKQPFLLIHKIRNSVRCADAAGVPSPHT